jgi:hypothetical protein
MRWFRCWIQLLDRQQLPAVLAGALVFTGGTQVALPALPGYRASITLQVPAPPACTLVSSDNPLAALLGPTQPDELSTLRMRLQNPEYLRELRRETGIAARPGMPPGARVRFSLLGRGRGKRGNVPRPVGHSSCSTPRPTARCTTPLAVPTSG